MTSKNISKCLWVSFSVLFIVHLAQRAVMPCLGGSNALGKRAITKEQSSYCSFHHWNLSLRSCYLNLILSPLKSQQPWIQAISSGLWKSKLLEVLAEFVPEVVELEKIVRLSLGLKQKSSSSSSSLNVWKVTEPGIGIKHTPYSSFAFWTSPSHFQWTLAIVTFWKVQNLLLLFHKIFVTEGFFSMYSDNYWLLKPLKSNSKFSSFWFLETSSIWLKS